MDDRWMDDDEEMNRWMLKKEMYGLMNKWMDR